jgi:hypothetical protein
MTIQAKRTNRTTTGHSVYTLPVVRELPALTAAALVAADIW